MDNKKFKEFMKWSNTFVGGGVLDAARAAGLITEQDEIEIINQVMRDYFKTKVTMLKA